MIDEKKLIKKINSYINSYNQPPYGIEVEGTVELLEQIKNVLNKQPKVGEWIPCSKRLPKYMEDVEVTTKDGERFIGHYAGGCWYDSINGDYIQVIAWKEPSEPWEGGKE